MKQRRGYTLIELVLVLLLLVLVAAGVFSLAASGSEAFLRLSNRQGVTADMRTGLSYLDVQIRKHDSAGAVSIRQNPFADGQALVIAQPIEGAVYLTWIYVQDGYLCELFVEEGTAVTAEMAGKITHMDEMRLDRVSAEILRVTLVRKSPGLPDLEAGRRIFLRSGGDSP
jgi:prepilin-type N-terminal cleavage/methylation domain-containing protein